jgi:regulator of protease activity HflC (stomatin/prohibitin superfamily)
MLTTSVLQNTATHLLNTALVAAPRLASRATRSVNNPLNPSQRRHFLRVIDEYQRGVTLNLGSYSATKKPGIRLCIPILQEMFIVDLRTRVYELEPQHIMTKDNVSTSVTAVAYYKIVDPKLAVLQVKNVDNAVTQLMQTQMRDVLCSLEFDQILVQRSKIGEEILEHVREPLKEWGVQVDRVQMKKIDLVDQNMIRAMAKEAEAFRDRKASIIRAEGEFEASKKLLEAAKCLEGNEVALEIRRLQTLEKISKEQGQHTVVVPMDFTQASLGIGAASMPRIKKDGARVINEQKLNPAKSEE